MLSPRKNSFVLLCLLLACCEKADFATEPKDDGTNGTPEPAEAIAGTGAGTQDRPFTVSDIRSASLSPGEDAWVIGYMVGTALRSMSNASFSIDASNQTNILLSYDSLCTDTSRCIPVELISDKARRDFSLPANTAHFRRCLLVKGIPSVYLNRKGLRSISAGLWLDGFDISTVAPQEWEQIGL